MKVKKLPDMGQQLNQPLEPLRKKPLDRAGLVIRCTIIVIAIVTIYTMFQLDNKYVTLGEGIRSMFNNFKVMFGEPHLKHFTLSKALYSGLITFSLALLTTILGAVIALGVSLLAARNLSGHTVSSCVKAVMAVIRAVPTILWVLIFAVATGLGSVAAVVGMAWHTVSYLTKAYSEAFEEIDEGVLEALRGSGASRIQVAFQAVFPSSTSYLLSWTFLRLEINFSNALAMGAAAGAGGLGFDLFMASSLYYDIKEIGALTYLILLLAITLEYTSAHLKNRLKVGKTRSTATKSVG